MGCVSETGFVLLVVPELILHLHPAWTVIVEQKVIVFLVFIFNDAFVLPLLRECIWLFFLLFLPNMLNVIVVFLKHGFRKLFLNFIIFAIVHFFVFVLCGKFKFSIHKPSNLI